jgi:hypothetical protein
MARQFHDDDRLKKANEGERRTYEWLGRRLPDDFDVFHEPLVTGRRPDVVVFGPGIGLFVLEVKDWAPSSITGVEAGKSVAFAGGKRSTHPVEQATTHLFAIRDALQRNRDCLNPTGSQTGKVLFPTSRGAVFWKMTRSQVEALGLADGYPREWAFSEDEIEEAGAWVLDTIGSMRRLEAAMNVVFNWQFSEQVRRAVRETLAPDRFPSPRFSESASKRSKAAQLDLPLSMNRELTEEQRALAKEGLGSLRLLQGVVGSGKTEVVIARAILYASTHPNHRLLVLCFNVSLASWLRKRIFRSGHLQSCPIDVANFHDWARDLLDRAGVELARSDFADGRFESRVLEAIRSGQIRKRYDAVIIDEGQDFSESMLAASKEILEDGRESFFVAMDNAQRIYEQKVVPLSAVGLSVSGKSRVLKVNERCTREINDFSRRFMWGDRAPGTGIPVAGQTVWIPESSDRQGDPVVVARCKDLHEQVGWAAQWCLDLLGRGYPPDEIAILYARSFAESDGTPLDRAALGSGEKDAVIDLATLVREVFAEKGVATWWLTEDRSTKADATVLHSRVTLSTIASFKGLEAKNVILFGGDTRGEEGGADTMRHRSLLYVGMTRATHRLAVPWTSEAGFGPMMTGLPDVERADSGWASG